MSFIMRVRRSDMKFDKDLARGILLAVEANDDPFDLGIDVSGQLEASRMEIAYHVLLFEEAGFLNAVEFSQDGERRRFPTRLTYEGHEFLDTVRDNEIWRHTKETARSAGVASLKFLFEIGKAYAREKVSAYGLSL
jgi:Hypothetical protein (DUF2513)